MNISFGSNHLACFFQVHKQCNTEGGLPFRCTLCNGISTIFQLYHGGQLFYWWRKSEYPEVTTDL
jgi:hypothetical protein